MEKASLDALTIMCTMKISEIYASSICCGSCQQPLATESPHRSGRGEPASLIVELPLAMSRGDLSSSGRLLITTLIILISVMLENYLPTLFVSHFTNSVEGVIGATILCMHHPPASTSTDSPAVCAALKLVGM
jgi:hypothetical protein